MMNIIMLLETKYTLHLTETELRTMLKAIQCIDIWQQGAEMEVTNLKDGDIKILREIRAELDVHARENVRNLYERT